MESRISTRNDQAFWHFIFYIFLALGLLFLLINDATGRRFIVIGMGAIGALVILRVPMIGLALLIVSTPLVELLPKIPYMTSVLPLVGVFTFGAFLLRNGLKAPITWRPTLLEALILLYIFYVFISNPQASLYGSGRSWIFTFAQLWVLLWMARVFVHSEQDHFLIMTVVSLGILASAIVAVQEGGFAIGLADRASGLSGGANTASRYFIYGILMLGYMQSRFSTRAGLRLFALGGIAVLILALIFTGSRTGLLLLGIGIFLLAQRFLIGRQRSFALWILFGVGLAWFFRQASGTILDPVRILDAVLSGSDTVGARYDFWRAGWAMWLDHPIFGVGIGRFGFFLPTYWHSSRSLMGSSAHNTYVQILSETGIVGFALVASVLIVGLKNLRSNSKVLPRNMSDIYWTWLAITIVLLIGGMTKTDLFDKFLWFLIGLSASETEK